MKRYIILCATALLMYSGAFAQKDTLNAVVQVENAYTPTVAKATKISHTPQVEVQDNNNPLDIVFSQKAHPYKRFVSEKNIKESMPTKKEARPGYARLGYGTNNNIDAKAIYSITPTKRDYIELQGALDGYSTAIDGVEKEWDSRFYSTRVKARYMHKFAPLSVGVETQIKNNVFNYQTDNFFFAETDKQNSFSYNLLAKVISHSTNAFSYKGEIGYTLSTRKYSAGEKERIAENKISASGNIEYELPNEDIRRLGAEVSVDGFLYNKTMRPSTGDKYDSYAAIRLTPYLDFNFDGWKVRLGINSDILTSNGAFFSIAPNCSIEGTIDKISLFAAATGGRTPNSIATIEELSPYWIYAPGNKQYNASYNIADINTGLRFSLTTLSGTVVAGYSYTKDDLLPYLSSENIIGTKFAQAVSRDLYVAANIGYDYDGWLNLSADARFDHWSCTGDDSYLLYKPLIQVGINAEARIYDGLYATVGYNFTGYTKADGKRNEEMNKLDVKLNYRFHEQMTAYLQGGNLLSSKHQIFPGCEAQGANIMGGVSVSF